MEATVDAEDTEFLRFELAGDAHFKRLQIVNTVVQAGTLFLTRRLI